MASPADLPQTILQALARQGGALSSAARKQRYVLPRIVPLAGGAVWVDDLRPQGFMGRTFAYSHPDLQLGNAPRYRSDDADAHISAGFRQIAAENKSQIRL